MALTPAQQRNAVSEGIALGLLALGRVTLSFDKVALDLAFAGAWSSWTHRAAFPQVNTDLTKGLDGLRAMTRANGHKRVSALYWEQDGGQLKICARGPGWEPNNKDDLDFAASVIPGGVPLTAWTELAEELIKRFERHA